MNRKPARIAVTMLVAVLSVLGVAQVGDAPGAISARTGDGWCC